MKIFIPTKNRHNSILTHHVFDGFDYTVLVHSEAQKYLYSALVPEERLLVTGVAGDAFGLTRQREWAVDNLLVEGEWCVFADDNIKRISAVCPSSYGEDFLSVRDASGSRFWRSLFDVTCAAKRFLKLAEECIERAEKQGTTLVGFSVTENPYFRGRKWREVGYVIGKMMLWKKDSRFRFDHTVTMEDFRNTAEVLRLTGSVVVNNYIFPVAKHYLPGGMGTYVERVQDRKRDVARLMELYPGAFRVKERKEFVSGTDLQLALREPEGVEEWRKKLQAEGGFAHTTFHPLTT